ncbi:MAG: hypothetical protein LBT04_00635 [Prevotellaceae bacterium]|jgi:NRPS condensation-like uncharacterized protein|nr:hypothetical protein [Prevotellaceae bacterium]
MIDKYKVEIFDIWQYLCQTVYEPLIRCRIDFSNPIDENILKRAVTLSLEAVPLINACFDGVSFRPRWIKKNFTGHDIVHVVKADLDTNKQIISLFSSNIDFTTEPQLKIHLIKKTDGDTACIIINHIVCDGAGFKEYLYLLSDLYTKCKNNEAIFLPEYHHRGIGHLFAGIPLAEKIGIIRSNYNAYDSSTEREQNGVTFEPGANSPFMETCVISKENLAQIKVFAKEKGATLNDMIMTAFARVFCVKTGTDKIMLPSTMNLRKYIPSGKYGIANLSTNCMCNISIQENDLFADTLKQVSEQMQQHKSNKNILKSVMLWNLAVHILPFRFLKRHYTQIVKLPVVSFTNLGIVNNELLNFKDALIENVYLTASIKSSPFFQLTASTYNDNCTLSCNIYGADCDKKWVECFLDDVRSELQF